MGFADGMGGLRGCDGRARVRGRRGDGVEGGVGGQGGVHYGLCYVGFLSGHDR